MKTTIIESISLMKRPLLIAGISFSAINGFGQWSGTNPITTLSYVGIGITTPVRTLHVQTAQTNGGFRVTQTTSGFSAVELYNSTSGGHNYALVSTGYNNGEGAGNFGIYDYTSAVYRMFIKGANVGIGTLSPSSKLHVYQYATITSGAQDQAGLFEWTIPAGAIYNGGAIGVKGVVNATTFSGSGTQYAMTGLFGEANSTTAAPPVFSLYHYGVTGHANGFQQSYGGYFYATGSGSRIGVYGDGANWGVYSNGSMYCTGTYQGSDMKLKSNIKPLASTLDKIKLLKPSTYTYKTDEFQTMNLPEGIQMGLVAQEVEKVFPELVKEVAAMEHRDEKGKVISSNPDFKAVNYTGLIPVLIAAIQEQQKMIEKLQHAQNGASGGAQMELGNTDQPVLFQNAPNPFGEGTTIKYFVPENSKATIVFYDEFGNKINEFTIAEKGMGQLDLTTLNLAAGLYSYSLIVNGKVADTKKMMKVD